jgi:hypothetical protein
VADSATVRHPHLPLSQRLRAAALQDWGNREAWRQWLVACIPDTVKEVWNLTVAALLLVFLVSLVNSIARVRWQELQHQQHAKRA